MTKVKRAWDIISDERRRLIITDIINYFECERGDKMGVIAAEEILDFMLQTFGSDVYNAGVSDSLTFLKERFQTLEIDMSAILKK